MRRDDAYKRTVVEPGGKWVLVVSDARDEFTVLKLLADVREPAQPTRIALCNLKCKWLQCDETWSFMAKKERNVRKVADKLRGHGDAWTWTAIDP